MKPRERGDPAFLVSCGVGSRANDHRSILGDQSCTRQVPAGEITAQFGQDIRQMPHASTGLPNQRIARIAEGFLTHNPVAVCRTSIGNAIPVAVGETEVNHRSPTNTNPVCSEPVKL